MREKIRKKEKKTHTHTYIYKDLAQQIKQGAKKNEKKEQERRGKRKKNTKKKNENHDNPLSHLSPPLTLANTITDLNTYQRQFPHIHWNHPWQHNHHTSRETSRYLFFHENHFPLFVWSKPSCKKQLRPFTNHYHNHLQNNTQLNSSKHIQ